MGRGEVGLNFRKLLDNGHVNLGEIGDLFVIRKGRAYNKAWRMETNIKFVPSEQLRIALAADGENHHDGEKRSIRNKQQ